MKEEIVITRDLAWTIREIMRGMQIKQKAEGVTWNTTLDYTLERLIEVMKDDTLG